jgi:glycosyltransferase involved in cell wall biosynthesis
MRIGINLRQLNPGRIGGLENYLRELIRHWTTRGDVHAVLFGTGLTLDTFDDAARLEKVRLDPAALASLEAGEIARRGVDVWFCPLLVLEPAEPGLPSAATIPDMQHERHPEFFAPAILEWRRVEYARTARSVQAVFTLSEFSRRAICEALRIVPDRVHATHLAAGPEFTATPSPARLREVRERYELPPRYLYYPANNWRHKNHGLLFEALARFRAHRGDCPPLVLTGSELPEGVDLRAEARARGVLDRVHWLGRVPAMDVPEILRGAEALVVPSLYEGFGIPLVEAMEVECPIACARATSLPEVAGDAAIYFDPEDAASLDATLRTLLGSPGLREELLSRGRARRGLFSWRRTAERTLEVLRRIVADERRIMAHERWVVAAGAARPAAYTSAGIPPAGPFDDPGGPGPVAEVREPPWVSIVTPSFQQAGFLRETLESVLGQGYPRLEYLVVDGGSTDGTVEILKEYQGRRPDRLRWISEPDRGQSDAVNKGLRHTRGEIVGWLSSDDLYEPGAIQKVVDAFGRAPAAGMLYGKARYIDELGHDIGPYPILAPFDWHLLAHNCYICQPAAFVRRGALEDVGGLDPGLQYCMDYDLWIRLGRREEVAFLDEDLALSRLHREGKTLGSRRQVFREIIATVKRHYGYVSLAWAYGYSDYLLNGVDQILETKPQGFRVKALTTLVYLRHNATRPGLVLQDLKHVRRALRERAAE